MDGAGGTASLRKAAASWNLAGDKQLLELLQNLHERIVTKCQETNSSLDEMINNLDTASISLQNVNNRLMALSNSQFVESRVYDDDVDIANLETPGKEPSTPPKTVEPTSEVSKLRDSLRILEAYHEPVHIVDSDSDSLSDEEDDRMVFKPKDLYADRPLPYIIGSQQWRSKWHAGLVVEDSDSESDTSKANPPSEQYSDSEPDRDDVPTDKPHTSQRTISTTSSIGSELTIPTTGKPADIAAELARRLGGNVPHVPEPEPESPPVASAPAKVIRPQQPVTANIFSDEPPPLDAYQSDQWDSEGDVFAELHRNSAPRPQEKIAGGVVEQLFGNVSNVNKHKSGYEDDIDWERQPNTGAKQHSPLFEDQQDSEMFAGTSKSRLAADTEADTSAKKPVGGISVFGDNQGAKSIGAAILKRNQRIVSSSDEDIEEPPKISKNNPRVEDNSVKTETVYNVNDKIQKDIINDLFSKSNRAKQSIKKIEKISEVEVEKPVNKKVDLFTDDLFDDIDDIFTNVKPVAKETKESIKKSLFDDEDDDDLFANVAVSSNKTSSKPESKSIFNSDDDLFCDPTKPYDTDKLSDSKLHKGSLGVSNNDLFSQKSDTIDKSVVKTVIESKSDTSSDMIETPTKIMTNEFGGNITGVSNSEAVRQANLIQDKFNDTTVSMESHKVKSIFDSDSEDDIFSEVKLSNHDVSDTQKNKHNIHNIDTKTEPQRIGDESALFLPNDSPGFRKIGCNSILQNDEIDVKHKIVEVVGDASSIKQIEQPLASNKEYSRLQINSSNTKTNVDIDKYDNIKKTDELTISVESSSDVENNTVIYVEDKLLPSTSNHENRTQNKGLSNILSNTNISKTPFRSPSLFDEDDNLDDIFTKSTVSNKSKDIDDKLGNKKSEQSPEIISNKQFLHMKETTAANIEIKNNCDVDVASNKNSNLFQTDNGSQITKASIIEKSVLKNDEPKVSNDLTKHLSDTLQESEISSNDNFDYSESAKKSSFDERKEKKTEYDNVPSDFMQADSSFPETNEPILAEPDVYSDLFSDIPPEFERPREPKRSKNVNALFDDDSDDEALFFKKNEIVTDDKPEVSFGSQDDRLFNIFHDEPPAMDVDFTQKSRKAVGSGLETQSGETHSEIFPSQTNSYEQSNFKSLFKEESQNEPSAFVDPALEKNMDDAKKPVGKLKPMNFNINVSTLLPGASPKKTKTFEQVDGQVISSKSTSDAANDEEPKMVKSVSFEGDPESEVLDNKLSKERAKIQVKRRPSSRRARKEAVRKSGIDFGDDSTDNSSSTDISKNDNSTNNSNLLINSDNNTMQNSDSLNTHRNAQIYSNTVVNKADFKNPEEEAKDVDNNKIFGVSEPDGLERKQLKVDDRESECINNLETKIAENINGNNTTTDELKKEVIENSNLTMAFNKRPNVKSKVIYILNDEDIFTDTKPVTESSEINEKVSEIPQNVAKNKVLNIVDDDDDLFKSSTSKSSNITSEGNVYKENIRNEIDNFDSDEDIFKASHSQLVKNTESNMKSSDNKNKIDKLEAKIDELYVKTQVAKVKTSLFDDLSDEESELFGSKKNIKHPDICDNNDGVTTTVKKDAKLPKAKAKGSLFGDDNDDDDLFGVRTTKKESSQPPSKPKQVVSKPSEPVFADPLSLLGQEDDDI